ncbi:Predicted metal-dependent phosphohydrolase, HD superfamily [Salinimicrobium sediminis]|uniref:Predicted metal-dependent phosphohydrolase, HD superfamily n=1 Tax=Salinimicrobium sediminis TaxID=1343891 RepID=A0A285X6E7_9FLAO|nr:Pycsar system effector family protein [Salinimicrobium sediminis]SOC80364.1 Predicted metal-dependent phosphohydrolase, HD superfamily [Salinimicrobium sediminis]
MTPLVEKTANFVQDLFTKELPNTFIYHNYKHTQRVVKSSKELIEKSQISVKQEEALLLAAWLHDTGYTRKYAGHEEESVEIAKEWLQQNDADAETIETVSRCILATRMHAEPRDILEEIIKDADTSHLAKDYFEETSEFLRQELKLLKIKNFSDREWIKQNIDLFTTKHEFYTDYARQNWKEQKDKNLYELLEAQGKARKKLAKEEAKARLKVKYKDKSPDRGIQTLFRVTMRNHLKLSDIADTKANILLSVNAIIISLAISNLIPDLTAPVDAGTTVMIPTFILMIFSVASIIGAIMSTRPNVTSGEFTKEQVKNGDVNVLFFGNFHRMPYDQFEWAMHEILNNRTDVYESLMKDLYMLGIVLNRKYYLLRITYTVFMIGIILSVLSFIVTYYLV